MSDHGTMRIGAFARAACLSVKALRRQVLDARDPAVTRKILTEHRTVLRERFEALAGALAGLHEAIATPVLHTPVHLRDEPATQVLALSEQLHPDGFAAAMHGAAMHGAAVALGADAHDGAAAAAGPCGGEFPTGRAPS